jgi:putative transposase
VHLLVDNAGRPLVVMVSPGQAGDSPALPPMLAELRVARRGPGRPRTRPLLLRADKAYSARAHRAQLRRRGIKAVIPEPSDQAAHRKRRGSRGGRPVTYDAVEYKGRNVIERGINIVKQWRGLATRYDKHALTYRGAVVLAAILTWAKAL